MNKKEFVSIISKQTGISIKNCTLIFNKTFALIKECFKCGEEIRFNNFGNFACKTKPARKRYIPNIKKCVEENKKFVPYFKPCKNFYKILN